jgi:Na+/melibiose symporter-like transporter
MSGTPLRRKIYIVCMIVIALLYVVSVPWYRDVDQPLRIWLGLPDWVAIALLCYVGVAFVNGIAWSMVEVSDEPDDSEAPK